ncbi:unnamed protein product, partial [Meganyctiphanes norvegica]
MGNCCGKSEDISDPVRQEQPIPNYDQSRKNSVIPNLNGRPPMGYQQIALHPQHIPHQGYTNQNSLGNSNSRSAAAYQNSPYLQQNQVYNQKRPSNAYNPNQQHQNDHQGPLDTEGSLFVVKYPYEARVDGAISINEGELIEVIDISNSEWWFGRSRTTGQEGYVPSNYLAEQYSLESEPWFFGAINRQEAIRRLMHPDNEVGSFLVRQSDNPITPCSLSVKFGESAKHYRIGFQQHDATYFITPSQLHVFKTLHDLVNFYKVEGGLCCNLGNACINHDKPTTSLTHKDEWEMDRNQVGLGRKLGSGQFGDVFEGSVHDIKVAVKTLKPGTMDRKEFLAEATLMKKLAHPNLIQLYAVCTLEEPIYIITEYMCNGDLLNHLRKGKGKNLPVNILIEMSTQVATGMTVLESQNFIHRDLAARNILVGENNIVKVADFGLARLIEEDEYEARTGAKFPVKWTAPEAATHCRFSTKSDVWAFGILLYEIITKGSMPYPGMNNREVMQQVEAGYRMPKAEECPEPLYEIMMDCWKKEPMSRPTFETLSWRLSDYYTDQGIGYYTEGEFVQMENQ